jgi:hypothetical protein
MHGEDLGGRKRAGQDEGWEYITEEKFAAVS